MASAHRLIPPRQGAPLHLEPSDATMLERNLTQNVNYHTYVTYGIAVPYLLRCKTV